MNKNICKALVLGATLTMASACSSSTPSDSGTSSAVTQLFTLEPTPDRSTLQKTATGYLATLLADPANQEITLVKVDPAVVSNKTQDLAVTLPNGQAAQFHLRDYNTMIPGIDGWVGYKPSAWKLQHSSTPSEIDIDPIYYLSLVREGDKVVGSVIVDGQRYRLETLEPGKYAFIKVDETKLPPEAEPLEGPKEKNKAPRSVSQSSSHSTIRVLMVSTIEARAANPNYRPAMAQALQDANAYMANSFVDITYELAGYFDADYAETGKSSQLGDLTDTARPLAASVVPVREALKADLVTMYSTTKAYCGMAYVTSNRATATSVVPCLSSMSHELGHNLGATHNWEPGNQEGNPTYMFGYRYTGTPRFRTQMSYDCSGGTCPRVPYHSNPRLTYEGVPLGTVRNHDVARRFNERRETVENFYSPLPILNTKVTVYDNVAMKGASCTFDVPNVQAIVMIEDFCPRWKSKIWSARVEGINPKTTLRLGNRFAWHTYTSEWYPGDFDVPTLSRVELEMPDGMTMTPHSQNLTKLVDRVYIFR